jgi:predicted esterase
MPGIQDFMDRAGPSYEFVFADGPYGGSDGRLWIKDPPGGKGQVTTDPSFDEESTAVLDGIVESEGPFYGILGYSQGTAATLSYLSIAPPGTFQIAMTFCSYVPTTHQGITERIEAAAPYSIPMYVYMSTLDFIITNCMTNEFAALFSSPTRATNDDGSAGLTGHAPPLEGAQGFGELVAFLEADHDDGSYTPPAVRAIEEEDAECPSSVDILLSLFWWVILILVLLLLLSCFCVSAPREICHDRPAR